MSESKNQTKDAILENQELLPPKNDIVFKALFTRGKESITKAFLEDILKIKIEKLDVDKSKDLYNDNARDKNGMLDLRAVINENVECNIEMQLVPHEKMMERFLYYWAKIYTANLKVGEEYTKLKKTISIIILDSEMPNLKEIQKAHTKWQIREEENSTIVLTSYLKFHIIEVPKAIKEYTKSPQDAVLQWMMFLDNPNKEEVTKIMEKNEDIREAKEELNQLSRDEVLRRIALKEELLRMDINQAKADAKRYGREEGFAQGREEGREEGRKEGIKQATKETKEEIVKKLYEISMTVEQIAKVVNLEASEVNKILDLQS